MIPLLILTLGSASAGGLDEMAQKYGLRAVETAVRSKALEDKSAGTIQEELEAAGLRRITMPVRLDTATAKRFERPSALGDCFWQYDVRCTFTAKAKEPVRLKRWTVRCVDKAGAPVWVPMAFRVEDATATGETMSVRVWPMETCWRAKGAGIALVDLETERAKILDDRGGLLIREADELGPLAPLLPAIDWSQHALVWPASTPIEADSLQVLSSPATSDPAIVEDPPSSGLHQVSVSVDRGVAFLTHETRACCGDDCLPPRTEPARTVRATAYLVPADTTELVVERAHQACP